MSTHTVEPARDIALEVAALRPRSAPRQDRIPPVTIWAVVGGLILAFALYIWTKWATGPNFEAVPVGADDPPDWNKVAIRFWEVIGWPLLGACLYWFVVRPWRREKRVTTDGLLCFVWLLLYFQDPLSSYTGNWFTYNSYAVNGGSWVAEMPGWMSFAQPGQMLVEPFVWALPAYVYGLFIGTVIACWAMRKVQNRWPGIHPVGLMTFAWGFMALLDVILEGVIWMPFGLYTYGGGHMELIGNHYYKFPLSEAVLWGFAWAALASVRYFKDDNGLTIAEKGIERLRIGSKQKVALRFLALLGLCQVLFFVTFTVPTSLLVGANSAEWPTETQNTTYMNNGICGQGTDRACPGPGVPNYKPDSPYMGRDGTFVYPDATKPQR